MKNANTKNSNNKTHDFTDYCKNIFVPIHGNTIMPLIEIKPEEIDTLLDIYNKDCFQRWKNIKNYIPSLKNYKKIKQIKQKDISFVTSFYIISLQNYIEYIK